MLTIGADVGGTKLLAVVADGDGTVLAETLHPSGDGPDEVLAGLAAAAEELTAAVPGVEAMGVGVAGMVDFEGIVRYAPNIPGIEGLEVGRRLEQLCRLPVAVDNDANVAALGEVLHGAARGRHEVLVLTFGTGIGGGVVTGGRVLRGRTRGGRRGGPLHRGPRRAALCLRGPRPLGVPGLGDGPGPDGPGGGRPG